MRSFEVRPATANELRRLAAHIQQATVKGTLSRWCVVVAKVGQNHPEAALYGQTAEGRSWLTSRLHAIDIDRGWARTRNSVNALAGASAEPSPGDLARIRAVLLEHALQGLVAIHHK